MVSKRIFRIRFLLISLTVAILIFFSIFFLTVSQKPEPTPPAWLYSGCDQYNTRFYPFTGEYTQERLRFRLAWRAEVCLEEQNENPAGRQHPHLRELMSVDLDADGGLEVWFRKQLLDQNGVRVHPEAFGYNLFSDFSDAGYPQAISIIQDSMTVYDPKRETKSTIRLGTRVSNKYQIADIEGDGELELITAQYTDSVTFFGCALVELPEGRVRWRYPTGPFCFIDAIADVDNDGKLEIVCTTYSHENQNVANDMKAAGEGYIFVLDRFGNRLWLVSFSHRYVGTHAAVADLDGNGILEVVGAAGSWERNWGEVVIIDGRTGQILSRKSLESSFTGLAIADLEGDGNKEIITATAGETSKFFVFDNNLNSKNFYSVSTMSTDHDWINSYVDAVTDLDGDGKLEIVGTMCTQKDLAKHSRHFTSKFPEKGLLVLDHDLNVLQKLSLDEKPFAVIVSDIIRGGCPEIMISADGVTLYTVE